MIDVATLGIAVNSTGVVTATRRMNAMTAAGTRAEGVTQRMTRAFLSLQGVLVGLGIGFVVREIIQVTDEFNLAAARIRLYTDSIEEAAAAQNTLLKVSNATRTDMFSTLTLFNRIAQARGELNRTTGELIKFTEQIQKLTVVSGANPQEARNAVIQLSQGLSSGQLRGEELRAVIEQLPAVARTIADSMGITIGKFRELAFEGKITAQTIIAGILSMADVTDARFREVPVTVGQAWQVLKNNAITAIAQVNNAVQGNQTLAQGLMGAALSAGEVIRGTYLFIAAGFDRVRVIFDEWIMLLESTGVSWGGLEAAAGESMTFLGILMEHFVDKVVEGITHLPVNIKAALEISIGLFNQFLNNGKAFIQTLALAMADGWNSIQHGASLLWLDVKKIFATGIDSVLGEIASLTNSAANMAFLLGLQDTEVTLLGVSKALRGYATGASDVEAQIRAVNDVRAQEQSLLLDQIALIENERRLKNAASQEAIELALAERDAIIARMNARLDESKRNTETTLDPSSGEITLPGGGKPPAQEDFGRLTEFAKQAARNMQSAFAEFFFDPFKDGLKGLLRGFIDVVRRMVAEILAQQVLSYFFGAFAGTGGFLGAFADATVGKTATGSRASGGSVQAGKMYQIAEFRRPEFFIPQTNGKIVPAEKLGGGMTLTVNVDARGALSPMEVDRRVRAGTEEAFARSAYLQQRGIVA